MRSQVLDSPDFSFLKVHFDAPGETVVAEAGAMVSRSGSVKMTTSKRGSLGSALKRRVLGGESISQNTFVAGAAGDEVILAPGPEGGLKKRPLRAGDTFFLKSRNDLARFGDVVFDTQWGGVKSVFLVVWVSSCSRSQGMETCSSIAMALSTLLRLDARVESSTRVISFVSQTDLMTTSKPSEGT